MRNLLDPEEMLSPELMKRATILLTMFLAASAALATLMAILTILTTFNLPVAFLQFIVGVGIPFSVWMIVRTLSEMLLAQHRLIDRMSVIAEHLSEDRQGDAADTPDAPEPDSFIVDPVEPAPAPTVMEDTETGAEDTVAEEEAVEEEPKPKRRRKSAKSDDS